MSIKSFEQIYKDNKQKIDSLNRELAEETQKIDELHDVLANLKSREHTLHDKIMERKDYIELFEKINNTTGDLSSNLEERRAVDAVSIDVDTHRSDKVKEVIKEPSGASDKAAIKEENPDMGEALFEIKGNGRGGRVYDATLALDKDNFKVLAGSFISPVVGDYPSNNSITLREANSEAIGEDFILSTDVTFNNLYSAATFILGYNSKNSSQLAKEKESGMNYKEFIDKEDSNG